LPHSSLKNKKNHLDKVSGWARNESQKNKLFGKLLLPLIIKRRIIKLFFKDNGK
jgi:hypothetical protein